jgi:Arc/MetJ-type ribon-helix-helix transcriptional regulator
MLISSPSVMLPPAQFRCCWQKCLHRDPAFRILGSMEVHLTPEQRAFARRAIEDGRRHAEEDAVREALILWEECERQRAQFLLTLEDVPASLARGEGRVITQLV